MAFTWKGQGSWTRAARLCKHHYIPRGWSGFWAPLRSVPLTACFHLVPNSSLKESGQLWLDAYLHQ